MDIACRPAMSRLRKRARRGVIPVIALLLVSMSGSGCAIFTLREVVPEQLADEAELAGMPHVRVWGDAPSKSLASLASDDGRRGRAVGELSQRLARQPIPASTPRMRQLGSRSRRGWLARTGAPQSCSASLPRMHSRSSIRR